MPRPSTGTIVEPGPRQRSWALRFRAHGRRWFVTLGRPEDGWDRDRAERELSRVIAEVRVGTWQPPGRSEPTVSEATAARRPKGSPDRAWASIRRAAQETQRAYDGGTGAVRRNANAALAALYEAEDRMVEAMREQGS